MNLIKVVSEQGLITIGNASSLSLQIIVKLRWMILTLLFELVFMLFDMSEDCVGVLLR